MEKVVKFVITSGLGFIIDFIVYNILTYVLGLNIDISNMISSVIGVSFVFFVSTKKIFITNTNKIKLKYKYLIYVLYQLVLIFLVSKLIVVFKDWLIGLDISLITKYVSILVKILITPFTLLINYFVMKYLTKW